jgi:hypothetical protein
MTLSAPEIINVQHYFSAKIMKMGGNFDEYLNQLVKC